MTCCGKFLCHGCVRAAVRSCSKAAYNSMVARCALCREKTTVSHEVTIQRIKKRLAANDGDAYFFLGCSYYDGLLGLRKNLAKAVELWLIGASLGSGAAQERLSIVYREGWIVKKDEEKALHYERLAAMKGHVISRFNLGVNEMDKGNTTKVSMSNAVKHWKIAAMAGWEHAMDMIEDLLSGGYPRMGVTVEIYGIPWLPFWSLKMQEKATRGRLTKEQKIVLSRIKKLP
jgi:TPR repeat protein